MKNRQWKNVLDYEGLYMISDDGLLMSLERIVYKKNRFGGLSKHIQRERIKKNYIDKETGYAYCGLSNDGHLVNKTIHRLVAEAFIPKVVGKDCVNHINGIKTDNSVSNLEWCTRSENSLHAYRTGLSKVNKTGLGKKGVLNAKSKPILKINDDGSETWFSSLSEASEKLNVYSSAIANCLSGRTKTCAKSKWKYA